jgi:hypothetical protein
MPFPTIKSEFETFLEPTRIFLFGKKFSTLVYDPSPMSGGADATARAAAADKEFDDYTVSAEAHEALKNDKPSEAELPTPPGPVEHALRQVGDKAIFARIYGFSFEGHYYKLPRPVLFLVRGEGSSRSPEAVDNEPGFSTRFTGVEAKSWSFGSDIRVWAVDKHDIAVCLDVEVGTYDQVLLQSLIAAQDETSFRTAAASRTAAAARTAAASRTAAAFRTAMVGPHQDR